MFTACGTMHRRCCLQAASSWLFTLLYPGYKFTLRASEINFNYKLPLKLKFPKLSFPFVFTYQNFARIFVSLSNATFASQLIPLGLISLILLGTNTHIKLPIIQSSLAHILSPVLNPPSRRQNCVSLFIPLYIFKM